jgi:Raf kinase inhibitor-like YbhB/YbcL family protein
MNNAKQQHYKDSHAPRRSQSGPGAVAVPPFVLDSIDIREGEMISDSYLVNRRGYSGQNLSPDLRWSHAPAGTKSFAITLFDPDARFGQGWWHWLIFDLPANVSHLPTGAGDPARVFMPEMRHGMTDYGRPGYGGPCPPKGEPPHRYLFTAHALDVDKLGVASGMTAENLGLTIYAQALASATLTATYGR